MASPISQFLAIERDRVRRGISRYLGATGWALLAMVAGLEGLLVIMLGAYASLTSRWPPWQAGAVIGGAVLLLALLVLGLVTRTLRKPVAPVSVPPGLGAVDNASQPIQAAGSLLADLLPKTSIRMRDVALTALVAGLVIGARPDLLRRGRSRNER